MFRSSRIVFLLNPMLRNTYIVSLLYCLLVVPKEIWIKKQKTHIIFSRLDEARIKSLFDIIHSSDNFASDYNYNVLHKLRNSIAHANFEVDENMNFIFWDEYKGKENFRCKVNANDLMQFLSVVGAELANLRTVT